MEQFFKKYILTIYWAFILLDCIFLYFDLPFIAVTEPLLLPILLLYMFLNDQHIGNNTGKFIFYSGLFFSFFGDVLQLVVTNGLIFITSLISFMLMNLCYSVSFMSLSDGKIHKPVLLLFSVIIFIGMGYVFIFLMGKELGIYLTPVIIYISTLILLATSIVNMTGIKQYSLVTFRYFVPAVIVLILQNIAFTGNLFYFTAQSSGFIYSLIGYAVFQYLMVKGFLEVHAK